MKMLPGVGVFGTGSTARVLVPLLRAEGFSIEALWGKTEEEAKQLAEEMNISFYTSRTDDVLLHQDVDLVCINIPPPLTRQIAVKALGIGKNVICEKAATSVDAFRMVTAARYYPKLMSIVGNVLRFLPAFVKMKQLIEEHYIGNVMICDMLMSGGVCSTVTLNFNMPGSFVHEVMIVGSAGRLIARGTDLYGQKNTALQEELLFTDSLAINAGLLEKGFKDIPLLYLKGMVYMVQALRQSFQDQEDRRTWDHKPVSMAASFEDGLYTQSVVDAIKKSSRSGEWETVEVMTEEPDANQNLCEALQRNNL
ncbi:glucose-fructose oxidoreductase domain-containing protein 2 isoform X2 [Alligator sinensis]|uniref:Glucose-fructose oxidoreductase domain-containing protein 2 n=1 Tax=Alligator sinensis TaxID=38654 RepID=A0A3Q0HKT0_ALLSI|nr:glucose-fructose oxidoreductase domain-containing protein 2 isoform X2 [Alligator sinensis]